MDFELPEELRIFKDALRRFVDTEMIPVEREATTEGGEKLKPEYYERFSKRAKDLGFWMMDVPENGGPGLSLAKTIVESELSRSITRCTGARRQRRAVQPVRHILFRLETEMKEKYLLTALRGEESCFAQTEPDAGSDPGSMRTAVRDGDLHVISSVKRFITGAGDAHFVHHGGDRPRERLARRHLLLHRRHGHARRETDHAIFDHDGRPAMGDRARERARAGQPPRRRRGRGWVTPKWLSRGRIKQRPRAGRH